MFPQSRRQKANRPVVLDVPYRSKEKEEEEDKEAADLLAATSKLSVAQERVVSQHVSAGGGLREAIKTAYPNWDDSVVEGQVDSREKFAGWWHDTFVKGQGAESAEDIPWRSTGKLLGMLGGTAVGWMTLDKILDSRRKAEQEA